MEFDILWDIIVEKNKNLQSDKEIRMKITGFKKAIRLAFDKGFEHGYQKGKNENSLFDNLFGKGHR